LNSSVRRIDWVTVKGIAFGVITDHDLDREGRRCCDPIVPW
jgi:hypothetical protein